MEAQKLAAAQGSAQETTLIQLGMSAEETAHLEQVRSGSVLVSFIWVVLVLLFYESCSYMVLDSSGYCSSFKKAGYWVSVGLKRERKKKEKKMLSYTMNRGKLETVDIMYHKEHANGDWNHQQLSSDINLRQ